MNNTLTDQPDKDSELLADHTRIVAEQLAEAGIEGGTELAAKITEAFRATYQGQQIYISKKLTALITERDQQIYNSYNGSRDDVIRLSKEFDLSVTQIYHRIRLVRQQRFLQQQQKLFNDL